jgi:hypothetical protein
LKNLNPIHPNVGEDQGLRRKDLLTVKEKLNFQEGLKQAGVAIKTPLPCLAIVNIVFLCSIRTDLVGVSTRGSFTLENELLEVTVWEFL